MPFSRFVAVLASAGVAALLAGFTTVRDVGADDFIDVALHDAINEGEIPGPRMFVSGPPDGIRGGHCSDNNLLPPENEIVGENVAAGPWEMRDRVRHNIKFGTDLIKTCSTGGVFSKGTLTGAPQATGEELAAIVDEAHMRGLRVAAHAHGTQGIKNAIAAGVDTIDHASCLDPGCAADAVAVPGDPLADIAVLERVEFVMKAGTVHRDDGGASP